MKLTFSWDDGAPQDQHLFELHEKYDIPGMFFVPTRNIEGRPVLTPDTIRRAESPNVAFGGHTENHVYLTQIPLGNVEAEVCQNQQYLEDTLGHPIDHFCLPGGKYNESILEIVFQYFKSIRTADTMNFRYNGNLLKPSIHVYPRGTKSLLGNSARNRSISELIYVATHLRKDYFSLVRGLLKNESKKDSSVVILWGHSWELEKFDLWDELEILMKIAKEYGCVPYSEAFKPEKR